MNKFRVVAVSAVVVAGGLTYAALSTSAFKAQAQQGKSDTDLRIKVERLEKQVKNLQKEVEQLRRRPAFVRALPPTQQRRPGGASRNWKPFQFGGQTYYFVPVKKTNHKAMVKTTK